MCLINCLAIALFIGHYSIMLYLAWAFVYNSYLVGQYYTVLSNVIK